MSDDFYTDERARVSDQLWMITSVVGACMCFVVLTVIGLVALHPESRRHLDRVSFRIMVYALFANMIFGIVNAVAGSFTGPSWTCGLTIWLLQLTLELASFLMFCIALNLQLVVVHRVNGQRMEKFYVLGSCLISLCITIPPYAAGQYGWDPLVDDCWYSSDNPQERLAWEIGSQLLWTLLTVLGEFFTSLTVFIYMIRHKLRNTSSHSTVRPRSGSVSRTIAKNQRAVHANNYRVVLARIAVYPIVSCVINLTTMCLIHATVTNGVHNMNEYRIMLLYDFLYGARPVAYALLAASDPSLLSAVKDLICRVLFNSQRSTMHFNVSDSSHPSSKTSHENRRIHIELSTIRHYDDGGTLSQTPHADKLHDGSRTGFISLPVGDHKHTPDARIEQSQESTLSNPDITEDSGERQIQEQDAFRRQI